MPTEEFRCGTIAIVGRPNVGKSTLLNALIGQKISITARKPQTTRYAVTGVLSEADTQFIFIDTPGYQSGHGGRLNQVLNHTVASTAESADVLLWLVQALKYDAKDRALLNTMPASVPLVVGVSKIDLAADKKALLPFLEMLSTQREAQALVPFCSRNAASLKPLLGELRKHLPAQPPLFEVDDITDRSERFLAAEFVREKLFRLMGEEIPYSTHVAVRQFAMEGAMRRIAADILVSRRSHKGMVVGNKGHKLKEIGTAARLEMERCFGGKVFLELSVREQLGWEDDTVRLREFGYGPRL